MTPIWSSSTLCQMARRVHRLHLALECPQSRIPNVPVPKVSRSKSQAMEAAPLAALVSGASDLTAVQLRALYLRTLRLLLELQSRSQLVFKHPKPVFQTVVIKLHQLEVAVVNTQLLALLQSVSQNPAPSQSHRPQPTMKPLSSQQLLVHPQSLAAQQGPQLLLPLLLLSQLLFHLHRLTPLPQLPHLLQ